MTLFTVASQTMQIEEKRYAHRRGSDVGSTPKPVSILSSPMLGKAQLSAGGDAFSDAGSHVGSFKLSTIVEPLQLPEGALEVKFEHPEDHATVTEAKALAGQGEFLHASLSS